MVLENGESVRINGRQGTFTVVEPVENVAGDPGYRVVSNKTLLNHFYREGDIKPAKKKKRGRK